MTLIVEDGTGLANAEAYATVAFADDYHAKLGNAVWATLTLERKEVCMRLGFNFMVQRFRERWQGFRSYVQQRGDWPRIGVYLDDTAAYATGGTVFSHKRMIPMNEVPLMVMEANCEYAVIANSGPLQGNLTRGKKSVKIGPLAIEYDTQNPQLPRYPVAASILAPLLKDSSGMMRLER